MIQTVKAEEKRPQSISAEHGNGPALVALLRRWAEEAACASDEEVREHDEMLANLERVRFRESASNEMARQPGRENRR